MSTLGKGGQEREMLGNVEKEKSEATRLGGLKIRE